jgi:hypothetical protein
MASKRKSSSETSNPAKRLRQLAPGNHNAPRRNRGQPSGQPSVFAVSADDSDDGDPAIASTKEAMAYLRTVRYVSFTPPPRNRLICVSQFADG